ncbi:diguanylate cyclase (GGDEF)-like protein [Paenibacillus intestini]|nr:diguanylate cyclase (GGDEF)-like protein [Paenibacillus intestini]
MIAQNKTILPRKEKHLRQISLTTLLSGLVIVSILLSLAIMVFTSYTSQKQYLITNQLQLNYESAKQMSQKLDSLFQSMQKSLKYGTAYFQNEEYSDKSKLQNTLEMIRNSSNYFNSVTLTDETGLQRSMSPYSHVRVGKPVRSEAAKAAVSSKASYISEAYINPYTKQQIVFVSEPIFNAKRKYKGALSGSILLQENNILNLSFGSQMKTGNGSYFFIVDRKGTVLFHPDINQIGKNISQNIVVQKLLNSLKGKERYSNLAGADSLAGYVKVPSTHWGIVVVTPTKTIFDQLNNQINLLLLYTLGPFVILILIVLRVASKLAHPFVSLANLVYQVTTSETKLPAVKAHWNREADLLTHKIIEAMENIKEKTERLEIDARTDVLTGLNNRRTFEEAIQRWIEAEIPFSIIVFDIDHFKLINDTFGHSAGDEVLKQTAIVIQSALGSEDVSSRFGGEEFVVLLRNRNSKMAFEVAENIRISVEQNIMVINQSVTLSAGIAEFPLHSLSATELFQTADDALYQAKQGGRNQTVIIQKSIE